MFKLIIVTLMAGAPTWGVTGNTLIPFQGISRETCERLVETAQRPPHVVANAIYPTATEIFCIPDKDPYD